MLWHGQLSLHSTLDEGQEVGDGMPTMACTYATALTVSSIADLEYLVFFK